MKIIEVKENKKQYLDLLLLADEQEDMVDRYLDNGKMYVLDDNGVKCECVITDKENDILEIKNIATVPEYQGKGMSKSVQRQKNRIIDEINGQSQMRLSIFRKKHKLGFGGGKKVGLEQSRKIWEKNAQFWDNAMGDESNEFHREVVRPKVTELLSPNSTDYILDIACGNGNYSAYLAQRGASIVAFDYCKKMIELAEKRQSRYAKQITFCVADATDRESILALKGNRSFTKAVSNMAIMDITDIEPLFMAVYELLEEDGIFVFATQHPCFITLTEKYMTPHNYYGVAIEGQPEEQIYYHRSMQDIFNLCFRTGFVVDGFYEECFKNNTEIPVVMIVRVRKAKHNSLG